MTEVDRAVAAPRRGLLRATLTLPKSHRRMDSTYSIQSPLSTLHMESAWVNGLITNSTHSNLLTLSLYAGSLRGKTGGKTGRKEGQKVLIIGMMNNPQIDLLAEISWAHENRIEFLDLTLEPSGAHPRQVKVKQTRRALKNANLDNIGHTAYYLPLASPFETLRKAALKEMGSTLEVFAELGASKVTVHPDKSIPLCELHQPP